MSKKVLLLIIFSVFLFLFQTIVVFALPVIATVQENPNQVYYEDSITITANIISTQPINQVILSVDDLDYPMTATGNTYTVSLHTIENLAALGFAVYSYTITAEDTLGNTATYSDEIEIIANEEGTTRSQSEIQALLDWIRLWI